MDKETRVAGVPLLQVQLLALLLLLLAMGALLLLLAAGL